MASTLAYRIAASVLVCLSLSAGAAQAAEPRHLLIHGRIVMPEGVRVGWLDIAGGRILHIEQEKPSLPEAQALETDDLIFPGFIDLHNHPSFNVLPRWNPPHTFPNRYAWRDWDVYQRELESKGRALSADAGNFCDVDEYAEVKALIGGTTSLIGLGSTKADKPTPDCIRGLVRNLDHYTGFYGAGPDHDAPDHERIANSIGVLPRDTDAVMLGHYAQAIQEGQLDLLAIHIAEGLPTDAESAQELDMLEAHGLLGPHTALIHAVGLSPSQLARVHRAGASIVWSPRSNFVLYGATANVDAAFREGVTMSLAPDWSPSGSDNMWEEIQYASQVNETKLDELFSNRQLVEMASGVPARVARIDDKVGVLEPGMLADFFLVHTGKIASTNPYDAIVHEPVTAVSLVVIGGVPVYGDAAMLDRLKIAAEPLELCGVKKALNSAALPNGSFAAVEERLRTKLKAAGTDLGPLDSCGR